MGEELLIFFISISALGVLGFFLYRSISKLDAKKPKSKKKKGRVKNLQQNRSKF